MAYFCSSKEILLYLVIIILMASPYVGFGTYTVSSGNTIGFPTAQ